MKTVITDNSLCVYPLSERAHPHLIYQYICALREAGISYVELDYRTIMKMTELPDDIGYIFRLVDPMFMELSKVFDFNYILLTPNDLTKKIHPTIPVMVEIPASKKFPRSMVELTQNLLKAPLELIRLKGSFSYMTPKEAAQYVMNAKNISATPIDICPLNGRYTALDSAYKFTAANVDMLTMTMGVTEKYASIEDYYFTKMTMFDGLSETLNMRYIMKAAIFQRMLFNGSKDALTEIMALTDRDVRSLMNVDTGRRVEMKISYKETQFLRHTFTTALERLAEGDNIPDDFFDDIENALRVFGANAFNEELLRKPRMGLLN